MDSWSEVAELRPSEFEVGSFSLVEVSDETVEIALALGGLDGAVDGSFLRPLSWI